MRQFDIFKLALVAIWLSLHSGCSRKQIEQAAKDHNTGSSGGGSNVSKIATGSSALGVASRTNVNLLAFTVLSGKDPAFRWMARDLI